MFKVLPFMEENCWQRYRVVDTDKPIQRDEWTNEMQYKEMCQAKEKIDAEIICKLLNKDRRDATTFESREHAKDILRHIKDGKDCVLNKDGWQVFMV
jgi:hypothetical protein